MKREDRGVEKMMLGVDSKPLGIFLHSGLKPDPDMTLPHIQHQHIIKQLIERRIETSRVDEPKACEGKRMEWNAIGASCSTLSQHPDHWLALLLVGLYQVQLA